MSPNKKFKCQALISEALRSFVRSSLSLSLFNINLLDDRYTKLRPDSNPPKQSEDCYQSTPLPPSHHGWVILLVIPSRLTPCYCVTCLYKKFCLLFQALSNYVSSICKRKVLTRGPSQTNSSSFILRLGKYLTALQQTSHVTVGW